MSYKKIYYEDIWDITSKGSVKCRDWLNDFSELNEKLSDFIENNNFKGQAAENMKNYLSQVHGILIPVICSILQTYESQAASYYSGYKNSVDSGDGSDSTLRYTTIVHDEVNSDDGSIIKKLNNLLNDVNQVATDANTVKNNISSLVDISAYPRISEITTQITSAINKAKSVNDKAITFEATRANDFVEIDRLIAQAKSIINNQLGQSRIPIIAYQNGAVAAMCDIESIMVDLEATSEIVKAFAESDEYEEALNLAFSRDELIQKWEEESREWIQWVAVGIAVVGAIALTVVTAGGASPLVCVAVGAGVGGITAASSNFADNYVKTGSLTEGMDWSSFGKDVLIGTVVGGVSGYLGTLSQGSAIKQPIDKALFAVSKTVVEEGTEGFLTIGWDVGEAMISGKPGDEILSILQEDTENMLKDVVVEGGKSFVGGYVSGKFDVDTSDKGYFQKLGEKTVESAAENLTGGGLKTVWEIGEAVVDPDSSKDIVSILKENTRETFKDFAGDVAGSAVSEGFSNIKSIKNNVGKIAAQTIKDTASDTVENITRGVTGRGIDYLYGDEKDAGKILGDIWEEDLKDGRSIVESAGKSAGKHIVEESFKDKKLYNDLKKVDRDHDGKIEVVQFKDYAVTKEDYDAAVANAGKGAYKDKTVQDILGLPKDTDIGSGKQRTVSIEMTEKYSPSRKTTDTVSVDGKYTFKQGYYESAVNVAGKGQYKDKTVQEILGVPDDTDISNVTHSRVKNTEIGHGKKVELTNDDSTSATKLHISSMKHTTKVAREKAKQK